MVAGSFSPRARDSGGGAAEAANAFAEGEGSIDAESWSNGHEEGANCAEGSNGEASYSSLPNSGKARAGDSPLDARQNTRTLGVVVDFPNYRFEVLDRRLSILDSWEKNFECSCQNLRIRRNGRCMSVVTVGNRDDPLRTRSPRGSAFCEALGRRNAARSESSERILALLGLMCLP